MNSSSLSTIVVQDATVSTSDQSPKPLCEPVSFELSSGSKLLITGRSGCGKTSFLNALIGFQKLHSGSVTLFDEFDVSRISVRSRQKLLRSKIAYVEQSPSPFSGMTAIEFMEFNQRISQAHFDRNQCIRLLEELDLGKCATMKLPSLSKGQLQRVHLCASFSRNSTLLIFDEPTSALDNQSRDAFYRLVERHCAQGGSTILVSHDNHFASLISNQLHMVSKEVKYV
ncbi:ATP-binding cassette domain-containing protein [Corynebacterium belfantii]|uniref:ABC transporter ATP-binding protein n=1 Tax=Corynebacterium belfantii TaxID=2014537 RepID=UPI0035A871FE